MRVEAVSICNMRTTEPLNLRVSPEMRKRVEKLAERYDTSLTSVGKWALVLGLEALEALRADAPEEGGIPGD